MVVATAACGSHGNLYLDRFRHWPLVNTGAYVKKQFVTFFSPGTFVAEQTTKCVANWDVDKAVEMMAGIEERYGAKPYGFRFHTMRRGLRDFKPKEIERSGMYYVNCKVETLAEIEERNDPKDKIMIENMRCNKWDRCVSTTEGWGWSQPLRKGDIVL